MILVDTSVLVDFLRGRDTAATVVLERLLRDEAPVALSPVIVQEVLQGAADVREWRRLERYLDTQDLLVPQDLRATHIEAARIYFDCRRRGITLRSTIDCLVAQIALEHDAALLHHDRDYLAIARVRPLALLPETG
jgi:predicted nucleic acid-binding protein